MVLRSDMMKHLHVLPLIFALSSCGIVMHAESPETLEPLNTVGAPPRTFPVNASPAPLPSVSTTSTTIVATVSTIGELTEIEIPVDMLDQIFDPETVSSILEALPTTTTSTTITPETTVAPIIEETSTSTLDTVAG